MSALPAVACDGEANGYQALQQKLKKLRQAADDLAERAGLVAQRMTANAKLAADVADMCAAAEVTEEHVGAINDVSDAFDQVATGGMGLVSAADNTGHAAAHLATTHQATYGGIYGSSSTSRVRQARPGFYLQR